MTCEILVMNRHAVALAADSAVTISRWVDGKEEKRYFKSVNKVFQISKNSSVAMMVYGSGELQQAPWELLAKEYRSHLGGKSFDTLEDYGTDIFSFIKNAKDIFPREYQEEVFKENCTTVAGLTYLNNIKTHTGYDSFSPVEKLDFSTKFLQASIERLYKEPFPLGFEKADIDSALSSFHGPLIEKFQKFSEDTFIAPNLLAEFAILAVFKKQSYMGETGVVIAGFGDKDYFPGYKHYKCFGNILGKMAYREEEGFKVGYHQHSHIKAFATTNMVDTFQFGIGFESYLLAGNCCEASLKSLLQKIGKDQEKGIEKLIEEEVTLFRNVLLQKCREANFEPLTRVVAALPVEDMAELAETLVALESLKEKVTKPTESVGGPVDVAVITRGEGLIWVKRKHYFTPELNPRYFQRQTN